MRLTAPVVLTSLLLGGCAEWPRVGNIPDAGPIEDAGVDPGDLVAMTWASAPEAGDAADQPVSVEQVQQLSVGNGIVVDGTLNGVGWADAKVPEPLTDAGCPGDAGTRSPLPAGDYIGDVDFVIVEIQDAGTLCAALTLDDTSIGWDLAPHVVNPCDVPTGILADSEGTTVGVDLGGARGSWSALVEKGDRIAVGLAGYSPNDDAAVLTYSAALSLVPASTAGAEGVCPTHPSEAN